MKIEVLNTEELVFRVVNGRKRKSGIRIRMVEVGNDLNSCDSCVLCPVCNGIDGPICARLLAEAVSYGALLPKLQHFCICRDEN